MAIEIYNTVGGTRQCIFPRVLSADICDKLSGERMFSFSVLASRSQSLAVGMVAKLDGQYYSIVRVSKKITGGFPVTTAQCEHITYTLNDEKYNLVTFVFEGTPADGMAQLLDGTPFSVGVNEATGRVECAFTDQSPLSRRNALMRFIDACGCEIEYDGYRINLRKHRGSRIRKSLMDGENVTDLAVMMDSRENTQSYEISLFKMADLQAGDEVNITYTPMGVNVDTRIISIEYDPFYRYTVRIEVGDFVPNFMASTATQLDRVRQEFKAADGKLLSSIETIDGNLSVISQTANRINWLVKSGTSESDFTMTDRAVKLVSEKIDLTGYVTISALGTAGKTTINGSNITTGTINAKLVNVTNLDASSITTGTISADRIDTSNLVATKIFTSGTTKNVAVTSSGTERLYLGGDGTWNFSYVTLYAASQIEFKSYGATSNVHLVVDMTNKALRPAKSSTWSLGYAGFYFKEAYLDSNLYFGSMNQSITSTSIGSSLYPWQNAYVTNLYLGGTKFTPTTMDESKISYSSSIYASINSSKQFLPAGTGYSLGSTTTAWQNAYITNLYLNGSKFDPSSLSSGTDMAGKEVKMGGTSSYYMIANTSKEFRPNTNSTTQAFYLGTATYYWHYAYLGSNTVKIGSTTSSKIGFFAAAPIIRQTLSSVSQNMSYSTATDSNHLKILNNLVGILVKYGLIGT